MFCYKMKLIHQLNRLCVRSKSTLASTFVYQRLTSRQLISVEGHESLTYLQGLITNDMNQLIKDSSNRTSIYAMMLNSLGRALYDVIIYSCNQLPNGYILECDKNLTDSVLKHLKFYKLRKKLDIRSRDDLCVWSVFRMQPNDRSEPRIEERPVFTQLEKIKSDVFCVLVSDPRLSDLGYRLILSQNQTPKEALGLSEEAATDAYDINRYKLGVAEGGSEIPTGNCLPLESNLQFVNGVSFGKGCYIGQELTARVHHTGVIRKRLLPVLFDSKDEVCKCSEDVFNENNQKVGKVRGKIGKYGLAVLRLEECLNQKTKLYAKAQGEENRVLNIETYKPFWWPESS